MYFSLNNTLWLDPMVLRTRTGIDSYTVHDSSVRAVLLDEGLAEENHEVPTLMKNFIYYATTVKITACLNFSLFFLHFKAVLLCEFRPKMFLQAPPMSLSIPNIFYCISTNKCEKLSTHCELSVQSG